MTQGKSLYNAVSGGALTVVDAIAKYAAWQQCIRDEASALSFQKTWTMNARVTMGGMLYLGAVATGAANVVEAFGTWRSVYATGMAERLVGKTVVRYGKVGGRLVGWATAAIAGLYAAMDFVDANQSRREGQDKLAFLQLISGATGVSAAFVSILGALFSEDGAIAAGSFGVFGMTASMTLFVIGFVLAVILVAITPWIQEVKGDNIAQWLERCYWGTLEKRRGTPAQASSSGLRQADGGSVKT